MQHSKRRFSLSAIDSGDLSRMGLVTLVAAAGLLFSASPGAHDGSGALGEFESQSDVGTVLHSGSADYDPSSKTYTVSGSGDNMWFAVDQFHFVWKKVTAQDLSLAADISILTEDGNNHRKGVLMIRQSLDTDSVYVDAARHGDGLTSLQFRPQRGANTGEIESNVSGPSKLRLEKQGDHFYMWVSGESGGMQFSGGDVRVEMQAPFYVGIGVTAHDKNAMAKVAFSNVELQASAPERKTSYSTVETVLQSGDARAGYVSIEHLTAPGWSADGHSLTYNVTGDQQQALFVPAKTAAPVGAPVKRPSESQFLYFSKKQGGYSQIWRKSNEGGRPERLTSGDLNNVFPHPSPDGKLVAFLSYAKGARTTHDQGEVALRTLSLADRKVKSLATFTGGRGSLGKDPWSPDGKRLVFVSYQSLK